jgi:RTA1 like protein
MDLVCIIIAPTLICAGIYLTLKHVARTVAPNASRLTPRLYTWIFIPFDIFCLLLQAAGGVVDAAAADSKVMNESLLKTGDNIMIAGIALQVVNLIIFGLFSLDFWITSRRHFRGVQQKDESLSPEAQIWFSTRFRVFCAAVACAYAGILVRCVYRFVPLFPIQFVCCFIWLTSW